MMGIEMLMKSLGIDPKEVTAQIQQMGAMIVDLHNKQMLTLELQRRICNELEIDISDLIKKPATIEKDQNNAA